jgi:two-component system NtrC family sensor kinase
MSIRRKMILLLALLFCVLSAVEILIQKNVLMPSFAELEREDAEISMKRIDYALDMTLEGMSLSATDWGNWADAYQFVQDHNSEFEVANNTAVAMKQLKVNLLLIVDLNAQVVLSSAYNLVSSAPMHIDLGDRAALPDDFPWRQNLTEGKPARGLVQTNQGVMLLVSAPILNGSGTGQHRGAVIMGRLLTPAQVRILGSQAQTSVTMLHDGAAGAADLITETRATTQVDRSYRDINGRPLMTLRVEVPRKITARGLKTVTFASVYVMVAATVVLLLLVIGLNRVILRPLSQVTRHAVAIGEGTDLTARLNLPGRDEVAQLAREFDRMVGRVAESRQQLVDQSYQAGFAELAKGVLHNLGNAMTPLSVRVTKLADRLRAAPLGDIELACSELANMKGETARRADLEEFLRLGSRELAAMVKDAEADVAVIQRQSTIVQTALSELMRSTRNEQVIESIRLPDLVAQTLEIVPDACRQRLIVNADESLRKVGVVHVARTVLRLILQNLIINAADAVRDAGREKGVLHLAAEIVREGGGEQLHLQCNDNGVGISKDNLQRVFEQGFSTKPRDTNHGIGLHWCANAISALGGRIWAASDGPGLGASMHLMLPLNARETRTMTISA